MPGFLTVSNSWVGAAWRKYSLFEMWCWAQRSGTYFPQPKNRTVRFHCYHNPILTQIYLSVHIQRQSLLGSWGPLFVRGTSKQIPGVNRISDSALISSPSALTTAGLDGLSGGVTSTSIPEKSKALISYHFQNGISACDFLQLKLSQGSPGFY